MSQQDDIHSCSYHCDRPGCIKSQRDELRGLVERDMDLMRQAEDTIAFYTRQFPNRTKDGEVLAALRERLGTSNDQPVGINGLAEAETAASASVMGLTSKNKEQ